MSDQEKSIAEGESTARKSRRLPDLASLLGEETKPADTPAVQPKTKRPHLSLDLSKLDDILEPTGEPPKETASLLRPPLEARKPSLSSLDALYDTGSATEPGSVLLPPELEQYLSADLWRRLQSPEPPRGVLINALERLRSTLYQISTFIPQHLVQEKMRRSVPGLVSGQRLSGTLLFSDVSGFTALSERLAILGKEGAEILTGVMNRYFTRMLEIIEKSGGILLKFAGDATLVYFPEQDHGKQANWAVRAGLRMLRAMGEFSHIEAPSASGETQAREKTNLRMKIGVATGEFLAASVGSAARMEYAILGEAVRQTMAAEGASTSGGQLITDQDTLALLEAGFTRQEHKAGFSLITQEHEYELDDFEIQAEKRRARGAIPWSASPQAIRSQIEVALRQIQSLTPYLPAELVDQVTRSRQRNMGGMYRRTAVMFVNFSGFEALLQTWGAEGTNRVTGLLSAYFNAMQNIISRFGGVVTRIDPYSKGTKLLTLFGAPIAHEDDPQRAVSAALAMNIELEELNESWQQKYMRRLPANFSGVLVQHRIGITYGDTFAGQVGSTTRREYTVMGDDVNLAARLMGAANPGQVLISQHACDAVVDYFVLTALTPLRVKGKRNPVVVHQVDGPRDDTLAKRMRTRGEIFGRETELAQVDQILSRVLQGEGHVLTICGRAGMGKSHLADSLLKRAAVRGMRVEAIQCRAYAHENPYYAWSALLRSLAGVTANDYLPQVHQAKLTSLASRLNLPSNSLPWLATLMGLKLTSEQITSQEAGVNTLVPDDSADISLGSLLRGSRARRKGSQLDIWSQIEGHEHSATGQIWQPVPEDLHERDRQALHQAVGELLTAASRKIPLTVFFEDAHWLDTASRRLVADLAQQVKAIPVLLLFAQRSEAEYGETVGKTINLEPINEAETREMVAHLLVEDISRVIHEQSNGNPLFIGEITRWFQQTHAIHATELRSVLESSDFLLRLVLSGLEKLPTEQQLIAKMASVLGGEFRTGEVQALLADAIDPISLSNHLRGLVRANLLSLVEAGADARYAFQPAYVREILYNSLPFEQRRELHAKAAAYLSLPLNRRGQVQRRITSALQGWQGSDAETAEQQEALIYHLELAQDLYAAADRLYQAGKHSEAEGHLSRIGTYYTRALGDLEKIPPENFTEDALLLKFHLLISLGETSLLQNDFAAALSAFETAWANLPPNVSLAEKRSLQYRLALVLPSQRRLEEAEKHLAEILRTAEEQNSSPYVALSAWLAWRSDQVDLPNRITHCQMLLASAEDKWTAGVQALLTDFKVDWSQALDEYKRLNLPTGQVLIYLRRGTAYLQVKDYSSSLAQFQQAVALSRKTANDVGALAISLYRQAEAQWLLQDYTSSQASLEEAANLVDGLPAALRASGQTCLLQAIKLVRRRKGKRWPIWDYQWFDDAFRIYLLYRKDA